MTEEEIRTLEDKANAAIEELKELKRQQPIQQLDPIRFHQEVTVQLATNNFAHETFDAEKMGMLLADADDIVKAWYDHMLDDDDGNG